MPTQNMYLAEDRILCLSLYCHSKYKYNLRYIPEAHAFVDPIMSFTGMLG